MEVVRNTEPWCCCCCCWPRGQRGGESGGSRVLFFCGGKIVLRLPLLLCEYCHDKAVKSISAVIRKRSDFVALFCLLLHEGAFSEFL